MSSNKAILHFPVEFDALYTDKGYWPYAIVELPNGEHFSVYFAQICSFDLPTMHDPCFAPPGLIVVPEVTIPNMEKAVQELYESGRFFPFFKPIAIADLKTIELGIGHRFLHHHLLCPGSLGKIILINLGIENGKLRMENY
jgi:hypothetical protein